MHPSLITALAAERRADLLRNAERRRLMRAATAHRTRRLPEVVGRTRTRAATAIAGLRQQAPAARAAASCCA